MPVESASYAFPWTAEHLAEIDEQIRLLEYLAAGGTATLTVDVPNYLSLHRYARELILTLDAEKRTSEAHEERAGALQQARPYRRPRGRPRKLSTIAKGGGLLAMFSGEPERQVRKGGRPRKYDDEFYAQLNDELRVQWERNHGATKRLNVKSALTERLWAAAKKRKLPHAKAARLVAEYHSEWYKPLMKYRTAHDERLNAKSQNLRTKTLDFSALEATFGRWQTAIHSGKHHAATKGRYGPQTGKARRRRK